MDKSRHVVVMAREQFFMRHNWQLKKCGICQENYYTKRNLPNCGSYKCSGQCYVFRDIPAPKNYLELEEYTTRFHDFFSCRGYSIHPPNQIGRMEERTLFASTAGQIYDNLIFGADVSLSSRCAVQQPVIRLQGINDIDLMEGISTSFLHTATEMWNPGIIDHYIAFDNWLDYLSSLGLYVGDLCFKTKEAINDWSGNAVTSEMLKINYGGLEIGIANFFLDIPQPNNTIATLSDIGVGAERLIWAINKSSSYFDSIGPVSYVIILKRMILDSIRTATLMASSGVIPDHKNQGFKLRAIIGRVADQAQCLNFYELVKYYYNQWSMFIDLPISFERTYSIIWREVNRNLNLKTNTLFKIDELPITSHEEYLRKAIQKKVISISHLWNRKKENI